MPAWRATGAAWFEVRIVEEDRRHSGAAKGASESAKWLAFPGLTVRGRAASQLGLAGTQGSEIRPTGPVRAARTKLAPFKVPAAFTGLAFQRAHPSLDRAVDRSFARVADRDLANHEAAEENRETRPGEGQQEAGAQAHE